MSKIKFKVTFLGDKKEQLKSFSTMTKALEWVNKNAWSISHINGLYLSKSDKESDSTIERFIRAYDIVSDFEKWDTEYLKKPRNSKRRSDILQLHNWR